MKIGVVKEIKPMENRVGLTPSGAAELSASGHQVFVERGAGLGSGFSDDAYRAAGASITDAAGAWGQALVIKVKEPVAAEYAFLQGQLVFTYFHLAGVDWGLTEALLRSGTTAIAYETLEDGAGGLPLLAPMSAVAGNMAVQMGSHYLAKHYGGKGMMLGEVLGERFGRVLIIGDGVVGRHAAATAWGQGARVTVASLFPENGLRLRQAIAEGIALIPSTAESIAAALPETDLLVGAVLLHGARAQHVVTEEMIKLLAPGSVAVDVSIDQGGCIETARPTTHDDPVYTVHGVLHYCVSNMPGAYPRTSTLALTQATLPFARRLADQGLAACDADAGFAKAVNTHQGYICCRPVALAYGAEASYRPFSELRAN